MITLSYLLYTFEAIFKCLHRAAVKNLKISRVYNSRAEEFSALIKTYSGFCDGIEILFVLVFFVLISSNSQNLSVYFTNLISRIS